MSKSKVNIANLFLKAAESYPSNIAIIEGGKQIDYAQLADEVRRTASYFVSKGIKEGDRVLVFVPMSIDLYRIVLALFHVGAAAVFLDEWVSKERLLLCCEIAKCKGFIGTSKARVFSFFAKELRAIPIKLNWRKKGKQGISSRLIDEDSTALITFTTGSTGTPKAADRSHAFLMAQFDILKNKIGAKSTDVDMPVLPIVLFVNLGVGCTSVIAEFNSRKPESLKAKVLLNQIDKHKVSRLTASPFVVKTLAEYLMKENKSAATLLEIYTGGAPVFPKEAQSYVTAFKNAEVNIIYGSTEAEPISSISAFELTERREELGEGLPVGKPHPKTVTKIIRITEENISTLRESELEDLEVKKGNIGEVIVSGDHVLKRYFNNTQAFAENKIVVGDTIWHRTGDSAREIKGELYLTGRCKQLIGEEGNYISPFIVENILQEIDDISMGTIIEKGERLVLVVESKLEKEDLIERLGSMQYDELKVLASIPRDPRHFSKIDYPRLLEVI